MSENSAQPVIPQTMRAVLTVRHGGLDALKVVNDYEVPKPGPGEVLLRIAACAVNPHDIFTRIGMPGISVPMPIITGSDIAGEIVLLGSNSGDWAVGQRALLDPVDFSSGKPAMYGETMNGGRAEFVSVRADQLIPIPAGVPTESAAALPLAYGTAYRMLVSQGQITGSDRVLVLGASGGVGVACVQIARALGAEVMACASSDEKLEKLASLGANHVVNYTETSFYESVKAIYGKPRVSGGGGVTVAVNFTGGDTMLETQRSVAKNGKILCCGATAGFQLQVDARYWWTYEHEMIGSDGWHRKDLEELLEWLSENRIQPVIDSVLPLEAAAEAERKIEERKVVGKVLLKP